MILFKCYSLQQKVVGVKIKIDSVFLQITTSIIMLTSSKPDSTINLF